MVGYFYYYNPIFSNQILFFVPFIHKRFILKETLKKQLIIATMDQIVEIIILKINLESFTNIMNIYKMIPDEYFDKSTIEKKKKIQFQYTNLDTYIFMEKKSIKILISMKRFDHSIFLL